MRLNCLCERSEATQGQIRRFWIASAPLWGASQRRSLPARRHSLLLWDARLLDHVAPLAGIARHAIPHLPGRGPAGVDAKRTEFLLQIRSRQGAIDLAIEVLGDL